MNMFTTIYLFLTIELFTLLHLLYVNRVGAQRNTFTKKNLHKKIFTLCTHKDIRFVNAFYYNLAYTENYHCLWDMRTG